MSLVESFHRTIIITMFRFNIDNKYGRAALEATFKAIMGYEQPIVKPPSDYRGDFFKGKLRFSFFCA
jgi:hypothetical protein